jgi:hypothetical protein
VDLAQVGGTFPNAEMSREFESIFQILIQEQVRCSGPDFKPDDLDICVCGLVSSPSLQCLWRFCITLFQHSAQVDL